MKMKINQHQQLKNKIYTKQLQDLKLLQMPFDKIKDLADQLIETNPLVEIDEERSNSVLTSNAEDALQFVQKKKTLYDHLKEQLIYADIENEKAALYIIDSLDTNGYLTVPEKELREILHIGQDELDKIIKTIQTFTPPGICCRNLQECLLIQLCFYDHPYDPLAILIVYQYMELLAKNKIQEIASLCKIEIADVISAKKHIQSLNPKPGSIFEIPSEYIAPEILVEIVQDEIKVHITSSRPHFKIRKIETYSDKEASEYIKEKTNEAKAVIRGIEKRYETLIKVAEEMIKIQKDWFLKNERLKPLTYRELAEKLDLNVSTICRCVQDKYLSFNGENIALKSFFCNQAVSGISHHETVKLVKEIIRNENKRSPYSDQAISNLLHAKGIELSRRTVAKYRNELKIPSAKIRKQ